jgi:hypothetical protein
MTNPYDDILNLPHPVSTTRPRMNRADRAAQFMPFAALTGYEAAIQETARQTGERILLDESMKERLQERLLFLADQLASHPEIVLTCFRPDAKKAGGVYVAIRGRVKKLDDYHKSIILTDGMEIFMDDILALEGELFDVMT